jgi:hypothetical protein
MKKPIDTDRVKAITYIHNAAGNKPSGYRVDNPGGSWLREKQRHADKDLNEDLKGSASKGVTGDPTAYAGTDNRHPLYLPVSELSKLPGVMNEHWFKHPGESKFDELLESVQKHGYTNESPVFVMVNHHGRAYMNEGNTRAAVAKHLGIKKIRAWVYWMNGAEDEGGPWSPENVAHMEQSVQDESETASLFGKLTSLAKEKDPEDRAKALIETYKKKLQEGNKHHAAAYKQRIKKLVEQYNLHIALPWDDDNKSSKPPVDKPNTPVDKPKPKKKEKEGEDTGEGDDEVETIRGGYNTLKKRVYRPITTKGPTSWTDDDGNVHHFERDASKWKNPQHAEDGLYGKHGIKISFTEHNPWQAKFVEYTDFVEQAQRLDRIIERMRSWVPDFFVEPTTKDKSPHIRLSGGVNLSNGHIKYTRKVSGKETEMLANGTYTFGSEVMELNSALGGGEPLLKLGKFSMSDDQTEGTFRHECGHGFERNYQHFLIKKMSEEGADKNKIRKAMAKAVFDRCKRKKQFVSTYAETNEHECFAESFATYTHQNYRTKGNDVRIDPLLEEFFDEILLGDNHDS